MIKILLVLTIVIFSANAARAETINKKMADGAGIASKKLGQPAESAISGSIGEYSGATASENITDQATDMPPSSTEPEKTQQIGIAPQKNLVGNDKKIRTKNNFKDATVNVKKIYDGTRSYYEDTQTDNSPKQIKDARKIKPSAADNDNNY